MGLMDIYDYYTKSPWARKFYKMCINGRFYIVDKNGVEKPPKIVHQKKTEYGYIFDVEFPLGMCFEALHKKDGKSIKPFIEETFKAKVELKKTLEGMKIYLYEKPLASLIDFNADEILRKMKKVGLGLLCGYSRDGLLILNLLGSSSHHVLAGGLPGAGKSKWLRAAISAMILTYSEDYLHLYLIDFKMVELKLFSTVPQCKGFAYEPKDAFKILLKVKQELDDRQILFDEADCIDIEEYIKKVKRIPYICVIIDEFTDMNDKEKDVLFYILRKGRSLGISCIPCPQRASADIVPGVLKAMCPATVAFRQRNDVNSKIFLEHRGAADLPSIPGRGIVQTSDFEIVVQVPYLNTDQVREVVKCVKNQIEWEEMNEHLESLAEAEREERKVKNG